MEDDERTSLLMASDLSTARVSYGSSGSDDAEEPANSQKDADCEKKAPSTHATPGTGAENGRGCCGAFKRWLSRIFYVSRSREREREKRDRQRERQRQSVYEHG